MPDIRGQGLPFILTQPWKLPRLQQDGPPYNPDFLTGGWFQISRQPRASLAAHSYRQPTILTPAATFLPQRLRLTLAKPSQAVRPLAQSAFAGTVFANAAPSTFQVPRRTSLARHPLRQPQAKTTLRPPIGISLSGWQIGGRYQLTQRHRETIAAHPFRLPLAPAAAPTLPPVARRTTIAKPVQRPATRTRLQPPLTIIPAPFAAQVHPRVTLAPYRVTGRTRSRLAGPTTLSAPAVPSLPVKPSLHLATWSPTRLRLAQSTFRPPTVVGATIVVGWQIAGRFQLTAFPRSVPRVGFGGLLGPTIVNAPPDFGFALGLRIQLTAFPRPLYRLGRGRSFRLLPIIVGPFATPTLHDRTPRVTLARRQWQVRPTRSLRATAVIGAAPTTPATTGVNQDFAAIVSGW